MTGSDALGAGSTSAAHGAAGTADQAEQPTDPGRERLAGIVAVASLLALAVLVAYLLLETDSGEREWQRQVYLLSAVEAIAFAGAGWLFGREVHRAQAQSAEKRATKAEQTAAGAARDAADANTKAVAYRERGRALKHSIQALRATGTALPPHLRQGIAPAEGQPAGAGAIEQLAAQAERLFPDDDEPGR